METLSNNNFISESEITSLLIRQGYDHKVQKNEITVKICPFCHGDTSISSNQWKLGILIGDGCFNCFRCESKGNWEKFRGMLLLLRGNSLRDATAIDLYHQKIWNEGLSLSDPKSLAAVLYFKERGLGEFKSDSLRFHPGLMYSDGSGAKSGPFSVLLGKIVDSDGNHTATHRIYLAPDGKKADVAEPKKAVGKIKGSFLIVSPLATHEVAIAEGIETAIAVRKGTDLPTIAAISASNMKELNLPSHITDIYIFADQDRSKAGQNASLALAKRLSDAKKKVRLLIPDEALLEDRKSVDFLDIFNVGEEFLKKALAEATLWEPKSAREKTELKIRQEAFHGIAGEFVLEVSKQSESDPVAILGQFLVMIGNLIGRHCSYKIGATLHFLILYIVLVGDSAKSRKGDSLQVCLRLFEKVDFDWYKNRIAKGLSSGEGVIHALRDPTFTEEPSKNKSGEVIGRSLIESDTGVKDKRLLAIEGEFVSPLKVAARESNILTAILREAWDGRPLQTLTKGSAEKVMEPHFSLIGHITAFELKKYFSDNDAMNGTGNRIIWLLIKRCQILPFGGDMDSIDFDRYAQRLQSIVSFAKNQAFLKIADDAKEIWPSIYERLTKEGYGILGAMTARAEAQVIRLAMIYAVLDQSELIRAPHLKAALAVWDYSEESCRQLFGSFSGYPAADKILASLRSNGDGMTRSEIGDLFSRHLKSGELQKALEYLRKHKLVDVVEEATGGRPGERWYAV